MKQILKPAYLMIKPFDCIIIGAGIAGLTAAIALEQFGFSTLILEKSSVLKPIGAGIQLTPNATSLLTKLGILEKLLPHATVIDTVKLLSAKTGDRLLSLKTDIFSTPNAPFLSLHRADLQSTLLQKISNKPLITLILGSSLLKTQLQQDGMYVEFTVNNEPTIANAQLLIGADGVHSQLRSTQDQAFFSDYTAYRQTIEKKYVLSNPHTVEAYLAPNAHVVTYPIAQNTQTNVVLISKQPLTNALSSFHPKLRNALAPFTDWTSWPIKILSPNTRWQINERTLLIGDAAHAMLPFAAQGAGMAIEDGYCLAKLLSQNRLNMTSVLPHFVTLRQARITRVTNRSRFNALTYHATGPIAFARDMVFKVQKQYLMRNLKWLYDYRI
jgi:salicylate hydroxylase